MLIEEDSEVTEDEIENEKESHFADGQIFKCGGLITAINKKITKTNKEMAFVTIEDLYGQMELLLFPNVYYRYKNIIQEDKMFACEGKISLSNDSVTLIADKFTEWKKHEDVTVDVKTNRKICLRFDTTDNKMYNNVVSLLKDHPGDDEVSIKCSKTNRGYKINILSKGSQLLENDLIGLLGEENVKILNGELREFIK